VRQTRVPSALQGERCKAIALVAALEERVAERLLIRGT
jgi:hypothetical protein